MSNGQGYPPRWPLRLIRLMVRAEYLEEIEGDMEEVFYDNLTTHTTAKARRQYAWDTLKLIKPNLLKRPSGDVTLTNYGMFKNNVTIAFRIFKADKLFTAINIVGMSAALAIALLALSYVRFEMSYEKDNPQHPRLARITLDILNGETVVDQDAGTYGPNGPELKAAYAEVTDYARAYPLSEQTIQVGNEFVRLNSTYAVDPSFFELFNYPLLQGNQQAIFKAPHEVVLTQTAAMTLFNTTNVVGKTLRVTSIGQEYQVVGLVADSPANTHLKFSMLISYPSLYVSYGEKENNWNMCNGYTYLQLASADHFGAFTEHLAEYSAKCLAEEKLFDERIVAEPVASIHLHSNKPYEAEANGSALTVYFLLGVALLVIVIANVNYVNLATAKTMYRAKEAGVRKVVGASKGHLRGQFFVEAGLMHLLAALVAVFVIFIGQEAFLSLAELPPTAAVLTDAFFWQVLAGLVLFSTFVSGAFPALMLSAYGPQAALRRAFKHTKRGVLWRRSMVVFQFAITLFLLVQTITASRQLQYMLTKDLGMNTAQTVVLRGPNPKKLHEHYTALKNKLLALPDVVTMTRTNTLPGRDRNEISSGTGINLADAEVERNMTVYVYLTDHDFIPTLEMELAAGRNFFSDASNKESVLINERLVELLGLPNANAAIGRRLAIWGETPIIAGVVKNFHQNSAGTAHIPMALMPREESASLVSIRLAPGDLRQQLRAIEAEYTALYPESPFEFFFLDETFNRQYQKEMQFQRVAGLLTGFAIFIACLGLFGMVSFTIARRTKEIGVRKVLGASIQQLVALLSKEFVVLIVLAMAVAMPVTYYLVQQWLQQYVYSITLSPWLFVLPALAVLLLAGVTVLVKTWQIAVANPATALRDE